MKYLIIMPDYTQSCIVDEFNGRIDLKKLNLPESLFQEFEDWHYRYRKIIPLSDEQRKKHKEEIEKLDNQGLKLGLKLKEFMSEEIKIKYFSEGTLKFLPFN